MIILNLFSALNKKSLYLGPINKFANEKQKELYLKPYTTGKKIGR